MADNDSDHSDVDTSEKNCMYTNCNATSSYESTPCACTKLCRYVRRYVSNITNITTATSSWDSII
eukprot:m.298800 g.298800  ORF g.298800 m.298800 type:complete len:65 (-) comp20100_c0_seq1:1406-1600(-)